MPYFARRESLPDLALNGGIDDPRAKTQPSFGKRMTCRDLTEFMSNTTKFSPLGMRYKRASPKQTKWGMRQQEPTEEYQAKIDKILTRSQKFKFHANVDGDMNGYQAPSHPLSDLVPGLITTGGLSRSPAFDCLPAVSHWADRTNETSARDPAATVRISSTWSASHVVGEGSTMEAPLGAPAWSLKTHGIGPVEPGSSKFSQQYDEKTDTLITTVNLASRDDTPQTGGIVGAATQISRMRNARVADAVDCALELLTDASALLTARGKVLKTGMTERLAFAEVRRAEMPTWCSARKPLPPKLSGVALSSDQATVDLLESEHCKGSLVNASIFAMAIGYNRGVYGGSISGLWAIMDSAFVVDYTIGNKSDGLADSLSTAFADVTAVAEVAASAGQHITDIRIVKGCNYGCLRQKTVIEDTHTVNSFPCIVVWDDLARLARYKLADAVFCHVYYDAGGGEQMAAMAGLGCVVHDWIDLGADLSCGEVSNIIPSLTRGSLAEEPLAEVYSRLTGAMIWYRDNDPYNPAALCILLTHWWDLGNCRHRPVALFGRTDIGIEAAITATVPETRPTFEHFRASGTKVERGQRALASAEARLESVRSSNPLPQTCALIQLLVDPVMAYVKGGDTLPAESEYLAAVLAAEIAYPHGQKLMELWDLAIVMWESGAMWGAGVASLCYTHTGKTNCDRARDDLSNSTWT